MKSRNLILVLASVLALAGCKDEMDAAPEVPLRPVLSLVVRETTGPASVFVGTVEPRYQSAMSFRTLGRIVTREAGLGDAVRKGQQLASIDPIALELAVRTSTANVATAEAHLVAAEASERRSGKLRSKGVTSESQYELAQRSHETAVAALDEARANLRKSREQLGYASLRAEFDGIVVSVQGETGQVVSPGQTVMTIARTDARDVAVDIPDDIAAGLTLGTEFSVSVQIAPSHRLTGRAREIAPQSDPATRTRRVLIALDSPPPHLRFGTIATATHAKDSAARIALPASAVIRRDGRSVVMVVDPTTQTVSEREIRIARHDDSRVEIVDGLKRGDRIVAAGAGSLAQGQRVKLLEGTN